MRIYRVTIHDDEDDDDDEDNDDGDGDGGRPSDRKARVPRYLSYTPSGTAASHGPRSFVDTAR